MKKSISFTCSSCGSDFHYPAYEIAAYLGKRVEIKCKNCKHPNVLQVNLSLLEKENESETRILNSEVKKRNIKISRLIVEDREHSNIFELKLSEGISILGRKSNDDSASKLILSESDTSMSRAHCQIDKRTENGEILYAIKDLGSTNGTYLNGDEMGKDEEVFLMPGDSVLIGKVIIQVN